MRRLLILLTLASSCAFAGPYIPAGDLALRHDIQRLADYGIIKGPTSTWPLAWGPIIEDVRSADATNLPPGVADALARVRDRANWETRTKELTFKTKVGVAEKPTRIRSFQDTPRGDIEVAAGIGWIDEWFSIDLNLQGVDSDQDSQDLRADDSMIGVVLGNWRGEHSATLVGAWLGRQPDSRQQRASDPVAGYRPDLYRRVRDKVAELAGTVGS
jgi:hypothetical protein